MMNTFSNTPEKVIAVGAKQVHLFRVSDTNIDPVTVASFGEEWSKFNRFDAQELQRIGDEYFDILPKSINSTSSVLDAGCGSGRWAAYLSARVGFIECIDPSDAVYVAADLLKDKQNTRITKVDISNLPFHDETFDLVYSLGVLHHIPDTLLAMRQCVQKIKKGGYFLVYLYYNLDNRGPLFRLLFHITNSIRNVISKLPSGLKKLVCDVIAFSVYWPLSRFSKFLKGAGLTKAASRIPLAYYSDKSIWIMKNDALDRFGTPLEQRFSKKEILDFMTQCGLTNIIFSEKAPHWHAVGQRQ